MDDKNKTPQNGYSVDEILAEAHIIKNDEKKQAAEVSAKEAGSEKAEPPEGRELQHGEAPSHSDENYGTEPLKSETGEIDGEDDLQGAKKKKKKHFFSFFRRNKEYDDEDEEDDPYYGLKLKPLSEYQKEYENTMKIDLRDEENKENGDNSEIPEDMDETFRRIHEERRKRLDKIMKQAGMEPDEYLPDNDSSDLSSKDGNGGNDIPEKPAPEEGIPHTPPEMPPIEPDENGNSTKSNPDVEKPLKAPQYKPSGSNAKGPAEEKSGSSGPEENKADAQSYDGDDGKSGLSGSIINSKEDKKPYVPEDGRIPPKVREPVTVPHEKNGIPVPPPIREPSPVPKPQYKAKSGIPTHVISINVFKEAIRAEAMEYSIEMPENNGGNTTGPGESPKSEGQAQDTEESTADDTPQAEEEPEGTYSEGDNTIEFPKPFQPQPPQKQQKSFRLFGDDEPAESIGNEETSEYEEELDDYDKPEDAPSILNDLAENLSKLFIRLIASGIISAIMLVFNFAYEYLPFLPAGIHNVYTSQVFLIIQLISLITASVFCFPAISNGIKGIFKFKINADSAVSAAAAVAAIQNIALLILGMPSGAYLYSVLAVCALFFNSAGKFSIEKRIMKNFKYISSSGKKYAVQIFGDHNTALKLSRGCVMGEPKIAYETEAGFLKNFLRFSYVPDPGERTSQGVGAIGIIASLVLCAVSFILTKDVTYAINSFAAAMCISVPFMNLLSVNMPVAKLDKIASRCGSMVTGWHTVEHFSEVNAVMADDKDLFPKGSIILNGIKTFAGQRIDEAILDATALACTVGGPLCDVFGQIIKNKRDILPKVNSVTYIDGKGVTGLVQGKKILVGNSALIKENGIEPPSRDYERKYVQSGKELIYLASDGILTAMFVVSYHSERKLAMELKRMESNGISLIIRTRDPNITPLLISRCFGLSTNSVNVLSGELGNVYADLQAAPPERIDAIMATRGRFASMMRVLTACIRQRGNISIAVVLQNTGAILGLALAALFICTLGLKQLSVTSLVVFEAFWAAAVTFIPRLRRP